MERTKHTPGFTLVEILVVIGLIGLMMAALLSLIVEVPWAVKNFTCEMRLRKINHLVLLYESKFKGKPRGRGIQMLKTLWDSGVMEHTPENRDLFFCPHVEDDERITWLKDQPIDDIWREGFGSRDTSFACRADGRLPASGREPWMADDNEIGRNHPDGSVNVLYGSGAVRRIHLSDLRRKNSEIPSDEDYVLPVGADSPVPDLRRLSRH